MIVVAPTGVAAINAGGVTIHSFFQFRLLRKLALSANKPAKCVSRVEKINIIRSLDLLVIDEISMVRADILDAVDRVLRRFKNKQTVWRSAGFNDWRFAATGAGDKK
jgi:hypothetical protein